MTQAILFKFTLAALLLIWPAAVQSPYYPGPKVDAPTHPITATTPNVEVMAYCLAPTERRVCRIAREVAAAVDEHAALGRIPFEGPAAKQATVLALLEVAWHESGFRSKVEDCRITGDLPTRHSRPHEGLAISLFQLQANNHEDLFVTEGVQAGTSIPRAKKYSRAAICQSNALAARLALHALMRQAMVSRKSTRPSSMQGMFFSYASGSGRASKAGREHVEQFESMMRKQGLVMVPKSGATWVELKP